MAPRLDGKVFYGCRRDPLEELHFFKSGFRPGKPRIPVEGIVVGNQKVNMGMVPVIVHDADELNSRSEFFEPLLGHVGQGFKCRSPFGE